MSYPFCSKKHAAAPPQIGGILLDINKQPAQMNLEKIDWMLRGEGEA